VTGTQLSDPAGAVATRARRSRARLSGLLVGVAVVGLGVLGLWQPGYRHQQAPASAVPVNWARPAVSAAGLPSRSGVQITQVAVTGGGGLVDLRFRVLDPDKAHALHDPSTPPAVVDERSGLVLDRLLMGHAHGDAFRPATTYYLIFENTGNWVHRGSRVAVLLGDAEVDHVVVR
jgi:hypothetical protein